MADNDRSNIVHNIDPAIIRNFIAVVETGSLTLAAQRAMKTTAALSYQIGLLEAALGQKLFKRNGRGMTPSKEGNQFLVKARFLLQVYDQTINNKKAKKSPMLKEIICGEEA